MYERYTDGQKCRYWIGLSHEPREVYVAIEAHLHGLADSPAQRAWRDLWRPEIVRVA